MPRPAKKTTLQSQRLKETDVAEIWLEIRPDLEFYDHEDETCKKKRRTSRINFGIMITANTSDMNARFAHDPKRKSISKAHKILTEWCHEKCRETEDELRPIKPESTEIGEEAIARDDVNSGYFLLRDALRATQDLFFLMPGKQSTWAVAAPMIWQVAGRALETKGEVGNAHSATSLVIKFTSKVLTRMGHPGATPAAVGRVIEKFKAVA
ncbi:MAG: hypothetical protein JO001_00190 [Alphaproteobacteria bacterium]|nr:hypothetical protein [Alphaproteobacteria bacterium]